VRDAIIGAENAVKTYTLKGHRPASSFRRRFAGELNPQQLEVATAPDGTVLVLAGAGSGKTRAVTYRVAYLLDRGLEPEDLVLLTFTNKAAREMLDRVAKLVPIDGRRIWGGTFHRVANLILRRNAERLGFTSDYSILDREDARELLESAIAQVEPDPRARRFPKADVVASALSYAANTQRDLEQLLIERWPMFADLTEAYQQVRVAYDDKKRRRNSMDFDDLLLNVVRLLGEDEALRRRWAGRFRHVLVDEYQDTNRLQADMVDLLASEHHNLMAVGDDAQSIYSFRGSDYTNILEFSTRNPNARVLKLEVNYRSTPEILLLANSAIAGNVHQHEKTLTPVRPAGVRPAMVPLRDAGQQAEFVASRLLELRDEGRELNEIAVLYRSHWHSLELQMELARRRIPYEVRSGIRFFESAHVKDVLAHLRVVANPHDEIAWRRLLKQLPRVGSRRAETLFARIAQSSSPLDGVVDGAIDEHLPKAAGKRWRQLRTLIGDLRAPEMISHPGDMVRRILMGPYASYLYETFENAESRLEDLNQMALFALSFDSLESFLTELALTTSVEAETVVAGPTEVEPRVVLTTVHQAKGLEWKAVFVIWLVEGRFPSSRSLREEAGEEEERRLFYVAVTRTRDELYLCLPEMGRDEQRQSVLMRPSRFLLELPDESLERWQVNEEPVVVPPPDDALLFDDGPHIEDW